MAITRADEGFHSVGNDGLWQESWSFEWSSSDGEVAGFARAGYHPHLGEAWFWLYAFVHGRVVCVRDHEVPLGDRWGSTEHRGHGLWWDFRAQEALQAWSLQAETLGIEVDHPSELLEAEVGRPMPVGLDISFEAMAPPFEGWTGSGRGWETGAPASGGYSQFGEWSGELLLGDGRYDVAGAGERDHWWGVPGWWSTPWVATAFHVGTDLAVHAAQVDQAGDNRADGFVWRDGNLTRLVGFSHDTRFDQDLMPATATYTFTEEDGSGLEVAVTAEVVVPLPIETRPGASGPTFCRRGPARFELDGRSGRGHIEYNSPA